MRVVAIIAAYNEERFIDVCLEHLFANGVDAYLCDNQSTDRTVEIARQHLGHGLRGIEELPRDGIYRWRQILARKEQLASELDADWFLHLDPDEIPQSPRRGQTLAAAIAEADAAGYNAVEFDELTFVPTQEAPDHDHLEFRRTMHWYYPFAPTPLHRVIGWRRQPTVELVPTGGHAVGFPGRSISPRKLLLRHYLFLSHDHAVRKYVHRRYDSNEVRDGWHSWRPSLTADAVRLPTAAELRYTGNDEDLDPSAPRREHCLVWARTDGPAQVVAAAERPRVLCIVNRPGWAHDHKTKALTKELADRYELVTRYESELSAADLEAADLVLVYFWLQVAGLAQLAPVFERVRDRLLLGVCSEYELAGAWREPGLAMLASLPHAVFANNLKLSRWLESALERPVFYTPNGVDTGFFQPATTAPGSTTLRVGWAGSLTNHGNDHRGVHDVIAPAVAAVPGTELCLAAREDHWRGPEEMRQFYQSLDVYVCASRSEGTPNPCLEAAACGVPVVSTAVGNMPEFLRGGENGFFVARDPAAIAARLALLRDDPELRRRLGQGARLTAEAWDWRHQAIRYAAMFATALAHRAAVHAG